MKKNILLVSILLFGFGCTQDLGSVPTGQENSIENVNESNVESTINTEATNKQQGSETVPVTKPTVVRTFTYDEIEQEDKGGVKEWLRQLARDNAAGKKTLVRMPVNHIQGFGCLVPVKYCVSAITGGCYGPYVDLKGNKLAIEKAPGTIWGVEGYVVAASKVPDYPEDDARSCAEGELIYDFEVTKIVTQLDQDTAEDFKFIEYK